jgi:DNA polymerase iota
VFLDVTDMIDANVETLNPNDLGNSFFNLDKNDPTVGFSYDASAIFGQVFPPNVSRGTLSAPSSDPLFTRLLVASHLAKHLRHLLEETKGYTATVGISTSKLLAKLAGNVHRPKNQTTLLPPYDSSSPSPSNVTSFLDPHDIGQIPGIGFKLAQKIRSHVLGREATFGEGLIYGGMNEGVTVRDVRLFPGMGPELLEQILGGPGSPKGIGGRAWDLINGIDDTEVGRARHVPRQISIEDSYTRLDTFEEVKKELLMLAGSLIRRMHTDLLEDDDEGVSRKRWLAHPRTFRLSTRPRAPLNSDGTRARFSNRISRSCPIPNFIFSLTTSIDALASKLVNETLIGMFRKLHPEKSGWNLSLVNVAVTNMAEAAEGKEGGGGGRGKDIGRMFRNQESVLKEWKVEDKDVPPSDNGGAVASADEHGQGHSETPINIKYTEDETWEGSESEDEHSSFSCPLCGARIPQFAIQAHETFHGMED